MLINFPYIQRDTPVHRLDPRVKFILLVAYGAVAAQTINFWFILVGLIGSFLYYGQAKLKWSETKGVWTAIIILISMIVFLNYFISGGSIVQGIPTSQQHIFASIPFFRFMGQFPFVTGSSLPLSTEIIVFAVTQGMRNLSIALLAIPLTYTTDPGYLGATFKGMGLPDRFAYAIELSFRFLPTVGRDFSTTLDAQRARGFEIDKLRGGLFSKVARLAPMIVPVVIGSIVGAEDIINAMELRGFGLGKRTWLNRIQARPVDRIWIIIILSAFVLITIWSIVGMFAGGTFRILSTQGIPAFLFP